MVISSIGHCNDSDNEGDDSSVRIFDSDWARLDLDGNNGGVQLILTCL